MRRFLATGFAVLFISLSAGVGAVAQEAEERPQPLTTPPPAVSAEPATGAVMPTFEDPKWKKITPARGPAAREDHTWTVDTEGRYAYLFGGRDGSKSFGDLWRYDLEADTWKKLLPKGKGPSARSGHNAVWADGFGLVVFAGQRGADFFGDLWAYDPDKDKWTLLPAQGEAPKRRYGSCMIVGPDQRIWISHGFTFSGRFDDTRAYNLRTRRWADVTPDGRLPGERCLHGCFRSASGQMVLYGGQDNSKSALGDLWALRPDGTWKRETDPKAKPRRLYAVTEAGDYAWVFGGAGQGNSALDDLWRVDRETLEFTRVNVSGASPAARFAGTLITDEARGRLLLFGGMGKTAKADVWQLTDHANRANAEALLDEAEPEAPTEPVDSPEPAA